MPKPTYSDIAALAEVGTATVERVLNGRGGVRPATAEKVVLAARSLDWPGRLPDRHRGIVRIDVFLVRPETSFYARLARSFRRIAATLDPAIRIHITFLDESDPESIAERIRDPSARRSGLVISTPDYPDIRAELLRLHHDGLPIVQVVTQSIPDVDFTGLDNYAVGRTAGMMMARLGAVEGTVVAICHSQVYQVQRDRVRGFSDYLEQNPRPGLRFDCVAFALDDRAMCAQWVADAQRLWPDFAGLYNAGGGNTGVIEALRRTRGNVFFVGHELNDVTSAALREGTADVIFDQLPEAQARRAVDLLLWRIGLVTDRVENPPIRFTTVTAENL